MHLAVGGFEYPGNPDFSPINGANGDMGENDTAALDPVFFFHHCFIDYVFWTWQRRHGATQDLVIDPQDPGAVYNPSSGVLPPAEADPNAPITLDTALAPFRASTDGYGGAYLTSRDCIDIERQLGYTYGPGSLDALTQPTLQAAAAPAPSAPGHRVRVSRINRANIRGSFLISAFAVLDGKREYLGTEPVLSRWHVEGCMNCLKHLEAQAHFPLPTKFAAAAGAPHVQIEVEVKSRIGLFGGAPVGPARLAATTAPAAPPAFKVEIV